MGKVRVKVLDETEQQEKDKKLQARREQKKREKEAAKPDVSEQKSESVEEIKIETVESEPTTKSKYASKKGLNKKIKSKRYLENAPLVDKKKVYKLNDAVELLKKFKKAQFDETVELHINTREKGVSGQVNLPHGTGKVRRIKIADDALIATVEKGVIDFDVLVAAPQMMPKLAKVAKILGPRGLMPNPKNGTVVPNPEDAVKKLAGGQVNFKTESAAPIIHMVVGKASFENDKIAENIKTVVSAITPAKIENVTIKLTMSPAVKLDAARL